MMSFSMICRQINLKQVTSNLPVLTGVNDVSGGLILILRRLATKTSGGSTTDGNLFGDMKGDNAFESADDFERRIFGGVSDNDSNDTSFFKKLDKLEKARVKSSTGFNDSFTDSLNGGYDTFNDGLDEKLKDAATSFIYDEMHYDGYKYRPDVTFYSGKEYDIQDLDITKPAVQRFSQKKMVETSTKDVLERADFRNVRFLSEFMTEAGIIIKRSKSGISAKAQRKLAREIKTARAFGLMPFIAMGTKAFVPGRSMKEVDPTVEMNGPLGFGRKEPHIEL